MTTTENDEVIAVYLYDAAFINALVLDVGNGFVRFVGA